MHFPTITLLTATLLSTITLSATTKPYNPSTGPEQNYATGPFMSECSKTDRVGDGRSGHGPYKCLWSHCSTKNIADGTPVYVAKDLSGTWRAKCPVNDIKKEWQWPKGHLAPWEEEWYLKIWGALQS